MSRCNPTPYRCRLNNLVTLDSFSLLVDLVCNVLWSRSPIGYIVLDTEIGVGSTWVVTGGQEDSSSRFVLPDNVGSGRGRQNRILSNNKLGYTVG